MSTKKVIGMEGGGMRTLHMLHPLEVAVGDDASTVRLGFKWADLKRGDEIELCTCKSDDPYGPDQEEEHVVRGIGRVQDIWFGFFSDIPAKAIAIEHERRSREYWGLYDSMRKAYGSEFGEWSPVVVVKYARMTWGADE